MDNSNVSSITWEEMKELWPGVPGEAEVSWANVDDQIFNFIMSYLE